MLTQIQGQIQTPGSIALHRQEATATAIATEDQLRFPLNGAGHHRHRQTEIPVVAILFRQEKVYSVPLASHQDPAAQADRHLLIAGDLHQAAVATQ